MTKAEMQSHAEAYEECYRHAVRAKEAGDFEGVMDRAVMALPHVDGMMRYFEKVADAEFESVGAIDLILKYGPVLFAVDALAEVEAVLKAKKRIDREASADLAALTQAARVRMMDCHQVWSLVEEQGSVLQAKLNDHLGGEQAYWRGLAERMEEVGVLKREFAGGTYWLTLRTRLEDVVEGVCPACGGKHRGVKEKMLEDGVCLACGGRVTMVMSGEAE